MINKHEERHYENELYKRLSNSVALRDYETVMGQYFDKPVWWMIQRIDKKLPIKIEDIGERCDAVAGSYKDEASCLVDLCEVFNRARKSRKAEYFTMMS